MQLSRVYMKRYQSNKTALQREAHPAAPAAAPSPASAHVGMREDGRIYGLPIGEPCMHAGIHVPPPLRRQLVSLRGCCKSHCRTLVIQSETRNPETVNPHTAPQGRRPFDQATFCWTHASDVEPVNLSPVHLQLAFHKKVKCDPSRFSHRLLHGSIPPADGGETKEQTAAVCARGHRRSFSRVLGSMCTDNVH